MDHSLLDRLELALQASNEGVWDWYVGSDDIYYSERVLKFLGTESADAPNIIAKPDGFIHPDDLEDFKKSLADTLSPDAADNLATDCRYKHPDGQWHWLRIRGVVVRDDQGTATRMVGSFIDISERKRAEIQLEEERYRLRELIENIPVNVYYKDKDSRFVLANTSTATKLGAQNIKDLLGKTDKDFFDTEHADVARTNEVEIMRSRKPQINLIQRETWDGKEDTWAEISKLPWLDRKGKLQGTFGITSDITNLVRTQRLLTSAAEELRKRNIAFEEELQLAREIQTALLPRGMKDLVLRTREHQVSFASRYEPASEMAGDFYEVIPISKHSIGILVCDVMGHGVRASLVVSMLRGLMEKERASATSPDQFLHGINDGLVSILERADVTLFATAIYCVIDLKSATLSYSCAGHPAPLITYHGVSQELPSSNNTSPALGLIAGAAYHTETIPLDQIERVLLYTDGLSEVENSKGEEFGISSILEQLQHSTDDNLEAALTHLVKQGKKFSRNGSFTDDVCLFAIESHCGEQQH